jgi:fructose-1,6-bisphosphatase/inositol monophosphatase family enzyme
MSEHEVLRSTERPPSAEDDRRALVQMARVVADEVEKLTASLLGAGNPEVLDADDVHHRPDHPGDPAIFLDVAARQKVTETAREHIGQGVAVAGEEHGWHIDGLGRDHPIVVADPLDGSTNLYGVGGPWAVILLMYRKGRGIRAGAVAVPPRVYSFDCHGVAFVAGDSGEHHPGIARREASVVDQLWTRPPERIVVASVASGLAQQERRVAWERTFQDVVNRAFPGALTDANVKSGLPGGAPTLGHLAYLGLDLEVKLDRSTTYDAAHLLWHAARGEDVVDLHSGSHVRFHDVLDWFKEITDRKVVPPYAVSRYAALAELALDVPLEVGVPPQVGNDSLEMRGQT